MNTRVTKPAMIRDSGEYILAEVSLPVLTRR